MPTPAAAACLTQLQQSAADVQLSPAAAGHSTQPGASLMPPHCGNSQIGSAKTHMQEVALQLGNHGRLEAEAAGSPGFSPKQTQGGKGAKQSPRRHVTPARWQKLQQAAAGSRDIRDWLSSPRATAAATAACSPCEKRSSCAAKGQSALPPHRLKWDGHDDWTGAVGQLPSQPQPQPPGGPWRAQRGDGTAGRSAAQYVAGGTGSKDYPIDLASSDDAICASQQLAIRHAVGGKATPAASSAATATAPAAEDADAAAASGLAAPGMEATPSGPQLGATSSRGVELFAIFRPAQRTPATRAAVDLTQSISNDAIDLLSDSDDTSPAVPADTGAAAAATAGTGRETRAMARLLHAGEHGRSRNPAPPRAKRQRSMPAGADADAGPAGGTATPGEPVRPATPTRLDALCSQQPRLRTLPAGQQSGSAGAAARAGADEAVGGSIAAGADSGTDGTNMTGMRSNHKLSRLRGAKAAAAAAERPLRPSPPADVLAAQPGSRTIVEWQQPQSKVVADADARRWHTHFWVSEGMARWLLPVHVPLLQQGDTGFEHEVWTSLQGGAAVTLRYLESSTPSRGTISGSAWEAWAADIPAAAGSVVTMSPATGRCSVAITLVAGTGDGGRGSVAGASGGSISGPFSSLPHVAHRSAATSKVASAGGSATGTSKLRRLHGAVSATNSAGGSAMTSTRFDGRGDRCSGQAVRQPPAAVRRRMPKKSRARLSTTSGNSISRTEQITVHRQAAVLHQRGMPLDEAKWEAAIASSEQEALDHAHAAAVCAAEAAEEAGPRSPQLHPLPSEAALAALPTAQHPEPRAYFAEPFVWRYQASTAEASLGGTGMPESALLPPNYPGNPPRGSLWAVLTQGLQYRLLANMCTGPRAPIGWQVLALEDIPAEGFIIEYAGEYLSAKETKRREAEAACNDGNRCFLWDLQCQDVRKEKESRTVRGERSPVCVIDAKHAGNMSRLLNHNCSPNVKAVEVRQRHGYARILIFALRDIRRGEGLELDYIPNFVEAVLQDMIGLKKCLCGAHNCRGVTF